MPEYTYGDDSPSKPQVVDVVPKETVEPLMARHEEDLRVLRGQLADALREAEVAERRVNTHPAAAVYDDGFETGVLAHVAQSIANIDGLPETKIARSPAEVTTSSPDLGHVQIEETVDQDPSAFMNQVVTPAPPPPSPSTRRPRTVVVDRGVPRTVVVDRGATSVTEPPPPPPPSPPPPVFVSSPDAEQYIALQANVDSSRHTRFVGDASESQGAAQEMTATSRTRRRRGSRVPSRLLIQVGVVIVVIALLLLKLG